MFLMNCCVYTDEFSFYCTVVTVENIGAYVVYFCCFCYQSVSFQKLISDIMFVEIDNRCDVYVLFVFITVVVANFSLLDVLFRIQTSQISANCMYCDGRSTAVVSSLILGLFLIRFYFSV